MHLFWHLGLLVTSIFYGAVVADTATILYPTGYPTFNYIDDVNISYETTFTGGAYLVLNCYDTDPQLYYEWVYAQDPLNESGSYLWRAIGVVINDQRLLPFPTACWFDLGPNIGDDPSPEHVYQGNFSMVSTSAPAKTWALSASSTKDGSDTTLTATSSSSPTNGRSTTTAASTSLSSSQPSQPAGMALSSLSTGAKAGIGIGAAAGVITIFGAILYFIRLRRREARMKSQLAAFQRERDIGKETQKAELDTQVSTKQGIHKIVEHPTETEGMPVYEIGGRPVHGV